VEHYILVCPLSSEICQRHLFNNRFEFHPTNSGQVLKLLNTLIRSKEAGLVKLSNQLIRECPDLISPDISIIFNCFLATRIFPDSSRMIEATIRTIIAQFL